MAPSSSPIKSTHSAASSASTSRSRPASLHAARDHASSDVDPANSITVETLVNYLLAAKRSLSSMALVLRANDIATHARQLHEEAVIRSAQTAFLQRGISEQGRILQRVRKGLLRAYENGKREFRHIIKTLDGANGRLEATMEMLRSITVESALRPDGEEPRSLVDFIDEKGVDELREALKKNVDELKAAEESFDGDILRFETDLRNLRSIMGASPVAPSPSDSASYRPIPHLLSDLFDHSHGMAELLTSLTRHFDLCVTAVRTTEGGAALARRKAAEVTQSQGGGAGESVSISGVIAEQESHNEDLEPLTKEDRAEMVQVVVQDAAEVEDVVAELDERLRAMEDDFSALQAQAARVRAAHLATLDAFRALEEVGSKLGSYVAAEAEFTDRCAAEKHVILRRLDEMEELKAIYERYAMAYDRVIVEAERRRAAEAKIAGVWRKAKETADRLAEADARTRDVFRQDNQGMLPSDLWVGMNNPMQGWDVVPVREDGEPVDGKDEQRTAPVLDRSVVEAAKDRLRMREAL